VDEKVEMRERAGERPEIAYVPALDGVRGVAVVAVLLYHGGVSWAGGGFLGVEAFFVLSGFLITSLLVAEWQRTSTIRLRAFWARRARRLLPALFAVVATVGIYQAVAGPTHAVPGLAGDGIATLLYYGNWHQIVTGSNYFVQSGAVSPFQHTWSLAIEEQFYLLWPLILLVVVRYTRRRMGTAGGERQHLLAGLGVAALMCAVASAAEMALLYSAANPDRVYYGTDTRAQGLLMGAALAFGLGWWRAGDRSTRPVVKGGLAAAGVAGLGVLLAAVDLVDGNSASLYRFGFLAIDVAVVAVLASAVALPSSPVGRLLALPPLRAIGTISYGLYLWHFPLFLWLDETSTGLNGAGLLWLRLACAGGAAVLSYYLVEQPVRRRRVPRPVLLPLVPVGAGVAVVMLLVGSAAGTVTLASTVAPPAPVAAKVPTPQPSGQSPQAPQSWYGSGPTCNVALADTKDYFQASPTEANFSKDLLSGVSSHITDFGNHASVVYGVCPPKTVLFVGDSVAFTLAFGMLKGEQQYGVKIDGAPLEGCAFVNQGLIDINDQYVGLPSDCATEYQRWASLVRQVHPSALVVEMGWRDSFDREIGGKKVNLGDPSFDSAVENGIAQMVAVAGNDVPVLFLTVPWASAGDEPDGSPVPQETPARHDGINQLIGQAASRFPGQVRVLDIDDYVSPGNQFDQDVNGQPCRFDGLHFTQYCAQLLEPYVLATVRQVIADEPVPARAR
jgi:peptidoglycan/LPS O-acetylase OafA/YrhL